MDSSASSGINTGDLYRRDPSTHNPFKLERYGFIIAIIVGIGGLSIAGAGAAGCFHVGALSNMPQVDAIILMAVGGGATLFMLGIIATIKKCRVGSRLSEGTEKPESKGIGSFSSSETPLGVVYGPEVWPTLGEKWGYQLEILDRQIPIPEGDVAEGRVRIYIPKTIKVNGIAKDFTLNSLIEIGKTEVIVNNSSISNQFGKKTASGWIEIDKKVMPGSESENYEAQLKRVVEKDCRMPKVLQAVVLNLMVLLSVDNYQEGLMTQTCCSEKVGEDSVYVGSFSSGVLMLLTSPYNSEKCGVAACKEL